MFDAGPGEGGWEPPVQCVPVAVFSDARFAVLRMGLGLAQGYLPFYRTGLNQKTGNHMMLPLTMRVLPDLHQALEMIHSRIAAAAQYQAPAERAGV